MSSVRWHFFVFSNSVEKLCVSWALSLVECVAVWALKLPVVSAPLRSLHNRSPPDFLQLIPTYSKPTRHKVFLRNYRNTKEPAANICHKPVTPNSVFLYSYHRLLLPSQTLVPQSLSHGYILPVCRCTR